MGSQPGLNEPKANLESNEDFPTPLSPSITTLVSIYKLSYYSFGDCVLPSMCDI